MKYLRLIEATVCHYPFFNFFCNNVLMSCETADEDLNVFRVSVSQENVWALWWLWDSLSCDAERLNSFLQEITQEVENTTGVCVCVWGIQVLNSQWSNHEI